MSSTNRSQFVVKDGFPPIAWLKESLASGGKWPTVLIHSAVREEYRPDIVGPLSLFTIPRGHAEIIVDGRRLPLAEDGIIVSAPGDRFTLEYEHPAEALNFYFADDWVADVLHTLEGARGGGSEIDPSADRTLSVLPRLALGEDHVGPLVGRVRSFLGEGGPLALEEATLELLGGLLERNQAEWALAERLVAKRRSTRLELRRRLQRAIDHLIANSDQNVSLDELAKVALLSKFHLLRSFKQLTGLPPSRYLGRLKVQRAARRLRKTRATLSELAEEVGFSDASALSRAFKREFSVSPGAYARL